MQHRGTLTLRTSWQMYEIHSSFNALPFDAMKQEKGKKQFEQWSTKSKNLKSNRCMWSPKNIQKE